MQTISNLQQSHLQRVILKGKHYDLTHTVPRTSERFDTLKTDDYDGVRYSTHVDIPVCYTPGEDSLESIDLNQFILPLYVLHLENEAANDADFEVTPEIIQDYEAKNGHIPDHSFVAFSSNWSQRAGGKKLFLNQDADGISHTPGWSKAALEFLNNERQVTAIGHETLHTDSGKHLASEGHADAENYWLTQNNYQVEVLNNLKKLPTTGGIIFVSPVNINTEHGYSARVYAIA